MIQAKPFLKWAGGKRQLLNEIEKNFPSDIIKTKEIDFYVEPFLGGGSVFFYLVSNYSIKKSIISDINPDLILSYKVIKLFPEDLINRLKLIQEDLLNLDLEERSTFFYDNLRTPYNDLKVDYLVVDKKQWIEKVALLIALNKTCFNGLFRQNSKGEFNVPFGRYKNPTIVNEQNLRDVSLSLQNTDILCSSYDSIPIQKEDSALIYFDPPYRPIKKKTGFTKYSKEDFNDGDQKKLADYYKKLSKKDHYLLLSNSDTKDNFFDELYKDFNIQRVSAKRSINSKADGRGRIDELLIKNY